MKQADLFGSTDPAREVWALTSYRAGETSQILALAGALADSLQTSWQRVDIDYQPWSSLAGVLRLRTPVGAAKKPVGPWPRFVISAGLRNEPICRWIHNASGGHTRVIFLGRTWAAVRHFDLVVATPQYRLDPAVNVLENPLTLHRVTAAALQQARQDFSSRYGSTSGFKVGVLLGGNSGPYRFDQAYARRLARELSAFAAGDEACFLISSSSRTPQTFLAQLKSHLRGQHDIHDWRDGGENPYSGILAWSQALVVSADSIAMISEAVATGKRVLLSEPSLAGSIGSKLYHSAISWGHKRWTRDVSLVHAALLRLGLVEWLSEARADALACDLSVPSGAISPDSGEASLDATAKPADGLVNKGSYLMSTVEHIRRFMP
jgi:mitochondrial fission protein ELM1